MNNTWLRQKCSRCSGWVFYLPHWKDQPKHCVRCRLLEIDDLKGLFEWFLAHENKLKRQIKAHDEKLALAEREALRTKITQALRKFAHSTNLLIETCASDKELSSLAFRLAKERRLGSKPRRGDKKIIPKSVGPFLQAGAPGLGKGS